MGDGGVHQHRLATQLHGDRCIGSGAHAGVDQHRDLGFLEDDAQVVGVADAQAGADQAGQRHYRDAADLGQLAGDDRVVAGVHHHVEAVLHQLLGGLEGLDDVGEQGLLVGEDFQLDQVVPVQQLAGQAAGAHGLDRVIAAGGVRQDGVAIRRDHIQQVRLAGILPDVGAPHRHRDDLRSGGLDGPAGLVEVLVLAGPHQQARAIGTAGDDEGGIGTGCLAHRMTPGWKGLRGRWKGSGARPSRRRWRGRSPRGRHP